MTSLMFKPLGATIIGNYTKNQIKLLLSTKHAMVC